MTPFHVLMHSEAISFNHITKLLVLANLLKTSYSNVKVTFACSPDRTKLVQDMGFEAIALYTQTPSVIYGRAERLQAMYTNDDAEKYLEADLQTIRCVQPDFILYDWRLSLPIAAEIMGVSFWSVCSALWSTEYVGHRSVPYQLARLIPLPLRIQDKVFGTKLGRMIEAQMTANQARPFQELSKSAGLPILKTFQDYASAGELCLVPDSTALMEMRKSSERFKVVGPLLWNFPGTLPEELNHLKEEKPVIYFTLGTSAFPRDQVSDLVQRLLKQNYQLIMTKTGTQLPELAPHPDLYVYDFLPNLAVIQKSDLVISHGGILTIYEALMNGVPMINIPSIPDQQWHSDAVATKGAGQVLLPHQLNASRLVQAVNQSLEDGRSHFAAKQIQKRLKMETPEQNCLKLFDQLLSNPTRSNQSQKLGSSRKLD